MSNANVDQWLSLIHIFFTMAKFTIPDDKCLIVELNEKNGGRHQSFVIENEDLVRANTINELQVR